jgi:hypothetical protein
LLRTTLNGSSSISLRPQAGAILGLIFLGRELSS